MDIIKVNKTVYYLR